MTVGRGERLAFVASGSRYSFSTAVPVDAADGDHVVLHVGQREVDGTVSECRARSFEVTLQEDVGSPVAAGAALALEPPWLIDCLRSRVHDAIWIAQGTPEMFNLPNAMRVMGHGKIVVEEAGPTPTYENARRPLNEEQERAVERAFRSPISIIVAAPGTGKTLTLGALVESCYRLGLRVLVTAPSNAAVDLLMQQVCERLNHEPDFETGAVLRLGAAVGVALRQGAFGARVVLDDVVARLRPHVAWRVQQCKQRVDELAVELTEAHRAAGSDDDRTVRRIHGALRVARADLRRAARELRDNGRRLAIEARVVGATMAHVSIDSDLQSFDVVVVDEASMTVGPALFLAAGLARKHVVIAGDPVQLAAPVRSAGPYRDWLACDVFERLGIVEALQREGSLSFVTELKEQFRSVRPLCRLQSVFREWPHLKPARVVQPPEDAQYVNLFGGNALCCIDTAELEPECHYPWDHTVANTAHARLVADLIAYLDPTEIPPDRATTEQAVLVLAHYRGQVAGIRAALGDGYARRGVAVRTVHSAQGSEASTCILDLTVSRPVRRLDSSVLWATRYQDEGSRLLAVATSRARSRLIIVGNFAWMKKEAMPQGTLARLLAHLEEEAYRIPLREVLGTADRLRRARATAPSRAPDAQEPLPERESAEIARKGGGNHDSRNRDAIDHDSEEQSEALVLTQQR
jgi:hypothetical protein